MSRMFLMQNSTDETNNVYFLLNEELQDIYGSDTKTETRGMSDFFAPLTRAIDEMTPDYTKVLQAKQILQDIYFGLPEKLGHKEFAKFYIYRAYSPEVLDAVCFVLDDWGWFVSPRVYASPVKDSAGRLIFSNIYLNVSQYFNKEDIDEDITADESVNT